MPFDSGDSPALRVSILANALRGPLPFKWNFLSHRTCAMKIAQALWPDQDMIDGMNRANFFGLTYDDSYRVFMGSGPRGGMFYASWSPRPATVAAALERLAATPSAVASR